MSNLSDWFHDDITWCGDECSHTECERNIVNRLTKGGLYSMASFKNTETCPLTKKGRWIKIRGQMTAGGDPVYVCSNCGCSEHVYGIEHPNKQIKCAVCGSFNFYFTE